MTFFTVLLVGTFSFNFDVLLPLVAKLTLDGGARTFGLIASVFGCGALCGALILATVGKARLALVLGGAAGFGVLQLLLAPQETLPAICALLFLAGICYVLWGSSALATLLLAAPDQLRGRAASLYFFAFMGGAPLGGLIAGALTAHGGTRLAFAFGGTMALLVVAVGGTVLLAGRASRSSARPNRADRHRAEGGRPRCPTSPTTVPSRASRRLRTSSSGARSRARGSATSRSGVRRPSRRPPRPAGRESRSPRSSSSLVDGVPARLYRPVGGERDVLVWFHGSAWMIGDLDFCDPVVRRLTNRARCAVLSVDYRLAPEHPFPAAIDDAWAATVWASERFRSVAVGGDSAGGNLAAAVALRARDHGIELALQVLVYPVLDNAAVESQSYADYRQRYRGFIGDPGFGDRHADGVRYIWEVYVPDPAQRLHPDASPMQAASLRGVAPALILTAEHDILRGEAEAYARRLDCRRERPSTYATIRARSMASSTSSRR